MSLRNKKIHKLLSKENFNTFWVFILPYLVLVIINVITSLNMNYPKVAADEFGYLGNARYISGTALMPDFRHTSFYHFGYSLFILPAFWLFSNPLYIYKAVLFINSFLISFLYLPLYNIAYNIFHIPQKHSSLLSFTCCLYPAFFLQSKLALSENAFVPVYALLVAAYSILLKRQSYLTVIAFTFSSVFVYAIHPRALLLVPFTLFFLLLLTISGKLSKYKMIVGIFSLFSFYELVRLVLHHLKVLGWHGGGEISVSAVASTVASTLPSFIRIKKLFIEASGQIFYLLLSTYGLFLMGLIFIVFYSINSIRQSSKNIMYDNTFHLLIFIVITSGGIFIASTLKMLDGVRGDHFIYGRYNEGFLALYILLALIGLYHNKFFNLCSDRISCFVILCIAGLALFIVFDKGHKVILSASYNPVSVWGIYTAFALSGRFSIGVYSLLVIFFIILLQWIFQKNYRAGLLSLIILFTIPSVLAYTQWFLPLERSKKYIMELPLIVRNLGDIKKISYDQSYRDAHFLYYQYLLEDVVFESFYSKKGGLPRSSYVISHKNWKDAHKLNAQMITQLKGGDHTLWFIPEVMRDTKD
jgi:hypothetical protein